jgi:hypothetical protein
MGDRMDNAAAAALLGLLRYALPVLSESGYPEFELRLERHRGRYNFAIYRPDTGEICRSWSFTRQIDGDLALAILDRIIRRHQRGRLH